MSRRRWGLAGVLAAGASAPALLLTGGGDPLDPWEFQALRHVQLDSVRTGQVLGHLSGDRAPGLAGDTWSVYCAEPDAGGRRACRVEHTELHRSYGDGDASWCRTTAVVLVPDPGAGPRAEAGSRAALRHGRCS